MRELSMNEASSVVGGWDSTDNPTMPGYGFEDFSVNSKPKSGGSIFSKIGDAFDKAVDGVVAIVDRVADAIVGDDSARSGTTSCAPGQDLRQTPNGPECVTPSPPPRGN